MLYHLAQLPLGQVVGAVYIRVVQEREQAVSCVAHLVDLLGNLRISGITPYQGIELGAQHPVHFRPPALLLGIPRLLYEGAALCRKFTRRVYFRRHQLFCLGPLFEVAVHVVDAALHAMRRKQPFGVIAVHYDDAPITLEYLPYAVYLAGVDKIV